MAILSNPSANPANCKADFLTVTNSVSEEKCNFIFLTVTDSVSKEKCHFIYNVDYYKTPIILYLSNQLIVYWV